MLDVLRRKALWGCVVLVLAAVLAALVTTGSPESSEGTKRLAQRALGPTPMLDDLRELCDRIGGRPTGSRACERAIEWAAGKFRDAGADRVSVEPFSVPNFWQAEKAEAECLYPEEFPIRLAAAPYSLSTPGGQPLEARLVDAGDGTPEGFAKFGLAARGAIALVRTREMKTLDDLFDEYHRDMSMLEAARKAQVSALLLQSTRLRGLLYRHPITGGRSLAPLPAAIISREAGARLARLLEKGEVRVRLTLADKIAGAYESKNIVAEIPGREKREEIVLLGAHLDSWDLGTGALDNGVNVALVIDVARGIKELGLVPRRTLRFVLFTGEEQGMWGSAGYVWRHAPELDRHVAVVIFDAGSGRTSGFYLNGREELRKPVNDALGAVVGLAASDHSLEGIDGTDNFDFLLSGVPNLIARQDWAPYLPDYHAESDVLERVDEHEARTNLAIASVLVWGLAEAPDRPAKRQTRAEVEKLLKETKLEGQMRAADQWDDWVAGKSGVSR